MEKKETELTELIERAKGNRSFREYAKDAGVNTANLCKIAKGEVIPTPRTIKKLTSEAAKPAGGVTYDELMIAAGHKETENKVVDVEMQAEEAEASYGSGKTTRFQDRMKEIAKKEMLAIAAIIDGFRNSGISFMSSENREQYRFADGVFFINDEQVNTWAFDMRFSFQPSYMITMKLIITSLGRIAMGQMEPTEKQSIVFFRKEDYEYAKRYVGKTSIRGEVSIMLFDEEELRVVKECYLSHYYEGDNSKEIYLAERDA